MVILYRRQPAPVARSLAIYRDKLTGPIMDSINRWLNNTSVIEGIFVDPLIGDISIGTRTTLKILNSRIDHHLHTAGLRSATVPVRCRL